MRIYKGYDQESLDRQYDNRARVPDFGRFVQLWEAWSEEVAHRRRVMRDLRYGPGPRELLDIIPASRPDCPMQVFFHGGYWHAMDKSLFHFIADGFADHQVTTVAVNYPLAPDASMDEIVGSCSAALIWLHRHGKKYHGDPARIFVSGHSAGGHIAAMLMTANWRGFEASIPADLIKGGCAISGLFDLAPIRLTYLNEVLGLDELTAARNSPVLLAPSCSSPLIVAVGERESDEYHAQSDSLSMAWSQAGLPITFLLLPAQDHFSILEQVIDSKSALNRAMLEQMGIVP